MQLLVNNLLHYACMSLKTLGDIKNNAYSVYIQLHLIYVLKCDKD